MPSGQLLDMVTDADNARMKSYELSEILASLGLSPTMHNFSLLASDLSRAVGKKPVWTSKYIHSVYHQYEGCKASPLLLKAISILSQEIDGTPLGVAGSVYIKVLAQSNVPDGILIPANARIVKCARPGCPIWFVKTHPNQIYHDEECRPNHPRRRKCFSCSPCRKKK